MRTLTIISLITLILFSSCKSKDENEIYYCPMHPSYTSDHPGSCPICNMTLVKQEKSKADEDHNHKESDHSEHEGMNMDDKIPNSTMNETEMKETSDPVLTLSYEKQQSIGIVTGKVEKRDLNKVLFLYSTVAYDPELFNALVEYKSARRSDEFFSEGEISNISNLKLRLRQLGLSREQIQLWTSSRRDPQELILGGKSGRGHIYSQIYESDLAIAKAGMRIEFTTDVYPNKVFQGQVKSIDTILDQNNRTLRLRSEVIDSSHLLKPQMFGQTKISIPKKNILSLPTSAIIDTGSMKMVYLKVSPDKFKPTQITTGIVMDNFTEVISGVKEGDDIVVESTFLIDSEAKIRFGNKTHNHN